MLLLCREITGVFFVRILPNTQAHYVGKVQISLALQLFYIVTTRLQKVTS